MFTGIVESIGTVVGSEVTADHARFVIEAPAILDGVSVGDSIAVEGVCLTVVANDETTFAIEAVAETLARTTLGEWDVGSPLNVERAMPASGRFDGHIVQGHVDGVARIESVVTEGEGRRLTIAPPADLLRYLVEKGSVTVSGVSLTIASLDDATFDIALIPHTLAVTTLGGLAVGAPVNLEVDVLAKYVERLTQGTT